MSVIYSYEYEGKLFFTYLDPDSTEDFDKLQGESVQMAMADPRKTPISIQHTVICNVLSKAGITVMQR